MRCGWSRADFEGSTVEGADAHMEMLLARVAAAGSASGAGAAQCVAAMRPCCHTQWHLATCCNSSVPAHGLTHAGVHSLQSGGSSHFCSKSLRGQGTRRPSEETLGRHGLSTPGSSSHAARQLRKLLMTDQRVLPGPRTTWTSFRRRTWWRTRPPTAPRRRPASCCARRWPSCRRATPGTSSACGRCGAGAAASLSSGEAL